MFLMWRFRIRRNKLIIMGCCGSVVGTTKIKAKTVEPKTEEWITADGAYKVTFGKRKPKES